MLDCDLPHLKWNDRSPPDVMFYPSLIVRSILCPYSPGLTAGARLRFAPVSRTYKMVLSLKPGIASLLSPNINTKDSPKVQACKTTFKYFLRSQQNVSPIPFNGYSRSYIYSVNRVTLQSTQPFDAILPPILFLLASLLPAFSKFSRHVSIRHRGNAQEKPFDDKMACRQTAEKFTTCRRFDKEKDPTCSQEPPL